MRISALWTKLHTHSLICELPSILFFYFLLKVIAWSFLITFLWNYQEIMHTENPLLMFVSLSVTCVQHVYSNITAWVWFWKISSFSNCRLLFQTSTLFFLFFYLTNYLKGAVSHSIAFNVLLNWPNDVVRIHNLIYHGNWGIILQHLPSLYGLDSTWSHENDSYYENKHSLRDLSLFFFFFLMWVGNFWRERQQPLAMRMIYRCASMQMSCDAMSRLPIGVLQVVKDFFFFLRMLEKVVLLNFFVES